MADILNSLSLDGSNSSNSIIFANELIGGTSSTDEFTGEVSGETSSQQIKNRISSIVKHHLPEFIRSDYTLFVYFLEAYYRFLEQDYSPQEIIQDIQTYADIDKTTPAFVYYFLQNYAKDLPLEVKGNKRLLIKRISDLYTAKGSSLSFDILFRVLYNTIVEVKYPYENVLKASDGNWNQKTSIAVEVVNGTRDVITNKYLTYTYNGAKFETPILATKLLLNDVVEITLDNNKIASGYNIGEYVYSYDTLGKEIFKGKILSTPVSYSILQAGSGFRIGQIFNINYSGKVGSIVKVTAVNSTGGIEKLKIINFGYGYPNSFQINLDKDVVSSKVVDAITSGTKGTSEVLYIAKNDPTNFSLPGRYFDTDYLVESTYTTQSEYTITGSDLMGDIAEQGIPANFASIIFTTGAVARYPGAFTTNKGFISEFEIRLEDDLLYQPFAYQTNTDLDITKFYDTVIKLIHPAGQRLFNNRTLNNTIDVSANVATLTAKIEQVNFESYASAKPSDIASVALIKAPIGLAGDLDAANAIDNISITSNLATIEELLDSIDSSINSFATTINETLDSTDNNSFNLNVVVSDGTTDVPISNATYTINTTINDTADSVDSGTVDFNPYANEIYFAETYTSGITTF